MAYLNKLVGHSKRISSLTATAVSYIEMLLIRIMLKSELFRCVVKIIRLQGGGALSRHEINDYFIIPRSVIAQRGANPVSPLANYPLAD